MVCTRCVLVNLSISSGKEFARSSRCKSYALARQNVKVLLVINCLLMHCCMLLIVKSSDARYQRIAPSKFNLRQSAKCCLREDKFFNSDMAIFKVSLIGKAFHGSYLRC
ncbi:hypothetical protein VCUG_02193 [Vavraia culicis subsp. floridensis]|uniref:Uncharacterized protein n=1 Tax=Vavraia culicis (isolate floridensis) TaxID=948595 RepID=L2GT75_VAVCU|nr:uncharacterized protein VCUG_02193 [Vavraia culicis subsp. floridensis]ELA46305.1 hypothetical protein VCUG_02193 [Vavraia culicis subsp. floridensis]